MAARRLLGGEVREDEVSIISMKTDTHTEVNQEADVHGTQQGSNLINVCLIPI